MISDSFAANVCVVLVVTIFVPALPAVIIALVYDIVVLVFDADAICAATACARFSAAAISLGAVARGKEVEKAPASFTVDDERIGTNGLVVDAPEG